MFQDDQETPNTLNATFCFEGSDGKRKMLDVEVRHWITNHEAEIGTGAYGANAAEIPAAGLTSPANKKPADKQAAPRPQGRQDQHRRQHLLRLERLSRR